MMDRASNDRRTRYPVQSEDENNPAALVSWRRQASTHPSVVPATPRDRLLALLMLALGCSGILLGFFFPGARTEVVLGALLVLFAVRALVGRGTQSAGFRR